MTAGLPDDSQQSLCSSIVPCVHLLLSEPFPAMPFHGRYLISNEWNTIMTASFKALSGSIIRSLPLLALLLLAGCGASSQEDSVLDRGGNTGAATLSLDISASEITNGDSVTLTWNSSQASACVASGDWSGSKGMSGREVIQNITSDSQFVLSCNSPDGQISDYATVRVVEQPTAPSLQFDSNSTNVMQGDSVILSWSASNADSCSASGDWQGSLATSGSRQIDNLQQNSLFILDCRGAGGSVRQTVTVNVQPPVPTEPSLSFSASQTSVAYNGSVTLSWSSSDADSCTASGDWSGSKSVTGSESVSGLIADSSFTLECSGAGGTISRQVQISVSPEVSNGTATLSWQPPTENTDNTPLEDLAGFRIYYGTESGNYSESVDVGAGVTEYVVENLSSGTWYFVVTAYNSLGIESAPSDEVSKTFN